MRIKKEEGFGIKIKREIENAVTSQVLFFSTKKFNKTICISCKNT
jgi:hypothetical protein